MKNFDIKRNKEPLSDADIAKGQNFEEFMNAYTAAKPSFFKTPKFFAIAATVAIVVAGSIWLLTREEKNTVAETPEPFIHPLFENASQPDSVFTVDADQGGIFVSDGGSLISIPRSAFRDSAGNTVTGNVELRFKEYYDIADIFMAGIPMTYDSAGTTYHFESAGMIEVSAWQNGKALKPNPDSLIHVAIVSSSSDSRFNTYYLDTAAKNWRYTGHEEAIVVTPSADSSEGGTIAVPDAPVAPRIVDNNKPHFAISFDPQEFPELVAYKGVRFEVDETQTPYDKNDKKVAWEDVAIERMKSGDLLRITFSAGMKEASYVTYPVVDNKDFASAKAEWEKRNADYLALKKKREEQEANKLAALEAAAKQKWISDSLARVTLQHRFPDTDLSMGQQLVLREFILADFGIWNADCPLDYPDFILCNAKMCDQSGAPLNAHKFFLVEKGKNALYTYTDSTLKNFGYNPDSENMLWCITRDGQLATVSVQDFKTATSGAKKDVAFRFNVQPNKISDGEEARKILDIPPRWGI